MNPASDINSDNSALNYLSSTSVVGGESIIPVARPYLPDRKRLDSYIDGIYERRWLTNNGPLVQLLTQRLEAFLGVENLLLVSNGTLALQIACKALLDDSQSGQAAQAITTPFSFVATSSSLAWEGFQPVFADIDPGSFCLDPQEIEPAITPDTRLIMPVHVFGNACDVEAIGRIAERHHLKVIYDAAHAFGVTLKGQSLLNYGDAATLSFHATKVFHSIEGGAIVFKDKAALEKAKKLINFGITGPDSIESIGINAKMNEFSAAMGLCLLDEYMINMEGRKKVWDCYQSQLRKDIVRLQIHPDCSHNYAYFPVVFKDQARLLEVQQLLKAQGIMSRRYFYPSLDTLPFYHTGTIARHSRDISQRILCLPIFHGLSEEVIASITAVVNEKS